MTIGDGAREVNGRREPSARHPLLRALARRVDWVLMATSPPVDGRVYTRRLALQRSGGFSLPT